jgi:outer membrane protein OmpA-like peptidoglycan-associated protein
MKYFFIVVLSGMFVFSGCMYFMKGDKNESLTIAPLKNEIRDGGYFTVIYFETNMHDLDIEDEDFLVRVAQIQAISERSIYLSGHADKTGEEKFNMELSNKRAQEVKNYLMGLGIEQEDINLEYFGYDRPAQDGENAEAYARNRRVEIILPEKEAGDEKAVMESE